MKNKDSYEMTDNHIYDSVGKLEHRADVTSSRDEPYAITITSCRSQLLSTLSLCLCGPSDFWGNVNTVLLPI